MIELSDPDQELVPSSILTTKEATLINRRRHTTHFSFSNEDETINCYSNNIENNTNHGDIISALSLPPQTESPQQQQIITVVPIDKDAPSSEK